MRWLYIVVSYLLLTLMLPFLMLYRKTRSGLKERFGFYPKWNTAEGARIWLHGASAGDLLALSPMIILLREQFPGALIVVSTITNTGHLIATGRLAHLIDKVIYAPYDLWGATRRAVRAIKPDLLILEYTEIWPNLIRAVKRAGGKIALSNGRFSPEHFRRYQMLFGLIGNPLKDIDLFLMREADEAERALTLGAAPATVQVTGNTKFDALVSFAPPVDPQSLGDLWGPAKSRSLWIAGSTHEGEEEIIIEVFRRLLLTFPTLHLIIAPRYLERASRVAHLVELAGLSVGLRSRQEINSRVIILDTMGELSSAYGVATLVFVGGSFTRRGGQNILEPAAHGKPVLFGPHMENFHDSVQVLIGRGGIQVKDADHLYRVMKDLLSKPKAIEDLGIMAREAVGQISGASARNVQAFRKLLKI